MCVCVCMWWKFPFQPCFHIFFPGISGPKTREIRNGWSFAGLSPRHRGRSLGTGCPAAVPRGADPDVSRAIRRSPGTTAAWELTSWWEVSVMWNCWGWFGFGWLVFFPEQNGETWICDDIYARWWWFTMFHWDVHCASLHVTLSSCWGSRIRHSWCDARGKGLVGLACGSILLANQLNQQVFKDEIMDQKSVEKLEQNLGERGVQFRVHLPGVFSFQHSCASCSSSPAGQVYLHKAVTGYFSPLTLFVGWKTRPVLMGWEVIKPRGGVAGGVGAREALNMYVCM